MSVPRAQVIHPLPRNSDAIPRGIFWVSRQKDKEPEACPGCAGRKLAATKHGLTCWFCGGLRVAVYIFGGKEKTQQVRP